MGDKDRGREMRREGRKEEAGEEDENGSDEEVSNQLNSREKWHVIEIDGVFVRYSTHDDDL